MKWKTLNSVKFCKKTSLIESSVEILETGEMKVVESVKFNGVLLLACIQSKCVHLIIWGKDLTLPDFKWKALREKCLNSANFLERLSFLWIGVVGKRTDSYLLTFVFIAFRKFLSFISAKNSQCFDVKGKQWIWAL